MVNSQLSNLLLSIYTDRGFPTQIAKLEEEIKELLETKPHSEEWFEELCDVWVILTQHILANQSKTFPIVMRKVHRTLYRIKTGYYESEQKKSK